MPHIRTALAIGTLAAITLMPVSTASAQTYPVEQGTLQLVDTSEPSDAPSTDEVAVVESGQSLTIEGGGFEPGSEVQIFIESEPILLAVTTADELGFISVTVTVPELATLAIEAGEHTVKAIGEGASGGTLVLAQPVLLDTPSTDDGFPVLPVAAGAFAALAIVVGSYLFIRSTR